MEKYNLEAFKSVVVNVIQCLLAYLFFSSNSIITYLIVNFFPDLQVYKDIIHLGVSAIVIIIAAYLSRHYKLTSLFASVCLMSIVVINYLNIQCANIINTILIISYMVLLPYCKIKDIKNMDKKLK